MCSQRFMFHLPSALYPYRVHFLWNDAQVRSNVLLSTSATTRAKCALLLRHYCPTRSHIIPQATVSYTVTCFPSTSEASSQPAVSFVANGLPTPPAATAPRVCKDSAQFESDFPETHAAGTTADSSVFFGLRIASTLSSSRFKTYYAASLAPQKYLQLFASLDGFISAYCAHHGLPSEEAASFFNRLSEHAMLRPEEVVRNVNAAAQRLWTSPLKLEGVAPEHHSELCSMMNRSIREDTAEVMQPLCVLIRSINMLCIVRRDPAKQIFPPRMCTFRGGELPLQHAEFFEAGKKYRVPGFLATSFSEDVAYRFLYMKFAEGRTPVKWIVELDPRGRDSLQHRCKHVNFCENSDVPGEEEFLYAPYSVFTVISLTVPPMPTDDNPIVVRLLAAVDNLKEPEDLPLAPWY
jgi:hypothetical protein